jgi:hypothetical protein
MPQPDQATEYTGMVTIILEPGQSVSVELRDTDGRFTINYGIERLTVFADMKGSHKGDCGIIYDERYGPDDLEGRDFDDFVMSTVPE